MVVSEKRGLMTTIVVGAVAPTTIVVVAVAFPVVGPMGFVLIGWPISFYLPMACIYLMVRIFVHHPRRHLALELLLAVVNIALFCFLASRDLIFWLNWLH